MPERDASHSRKAGDHDFDRSVRAQLGVVMDRTPFAPTIAELEHEIGHGSGRRIDRRLLVLAAGLAVVVGATAVFGRSGSTSSTEIATVPTQDITGGPAGRYTNATSTELDLPTGQNLWAQMTAVDGALISAIAFGSADSFQLEIRRTNLETNRSELVHSSDAGGFVIDAASNGSHVVVLVSRHLTGQPPVLVESIDGGDSWSVTEAVGGPTGELGNSAVSVALSPSHIVVAGYSGAWSRDETGTWAYENVSEGENMTSVVWAGDEFVLASGVPDPERGDGSDSNNAFRRSTDGRSWSDPRVVVTDPSIRTVDGPQQLVARGDGIVLSIASAQTWDGGETAGGGTEVIRVNGDGYESAHIEEWDFHHVVAVSGGWITSALPVGGGDSVVLASTDGLAWMSIGPGVGTAVEGVAVANGSFDAVAINAFQLGSPPQAWSLTPVGSPAPPARAASDNESGLDLLPVWFDPATAPPVLTVDTTKIDVAVTAYFEQLQHPDVDVRAMLSVGDAIERPDGVLEVQWNWIETNDGTAYLRANQDSLDVIAIVDDALSLRDTEPIDPAEPRLAGSLFSRSTEGTFIDVFGADGEPIPSAPHPGGFEGLGFGSAAGPGGANLAFSLETPPGVVRIRALGVGGLFNNVTEFAIDAP